MAAPPALAAELQGTVLPLAELPDATLLDLARAPAAVRRIADRAGATQLLLAPARANGCVVSVELLRSGEPFATMLGMEQALPSDQRAAEAELLNDTAKLLALYGRSAATPLAPGRSSPTT